MVTNVGYAGTGLGLGYGGLGLGYGGLGYGAGSCASNCICSFPTLVILILIVLQFSRYGKGHDHCGGGIVDNGILFIIALFYLSCAGCGRGCTAY